MKSFVLSPQQYIHAGNEITLTREEVTEPTPVHAHDFIEIAYVAAGRGIHVVDAEQDQVSKGDLILLNANVTHQFIAAPEDRLVVYNCIFRPSAIDNAFTDCTDFVNVAYHYLFHSFQSEQDPQQYIKLIGIWPGAIEPVLETMYAEYQRQENGYKQIIRAELIKLLILVFRLYCKDMEQPQNKPIYQKLIVENALRYMKEHFQEELQCRQLAERAYLSTSYFSKIFKETTGITVIQALQDIRLNAAAQLLKETSLSVSEIAHKAGYSDLKYFYKLFRTAKGSTPGQYRKQRK